MIKNQASNIPDSIMDELYNTYSDVIFEPPTAARYTMQMTHDYITKTENDSLVKHYSIDGDVDCYTNEYYVSHADYRVNKLLEDK